MFLHPYFHFNTFTDLVALVCVGNLAENILLLSVAFNSSKSIKTPNIVAYSCSLDGIIFSALQSVSLACTFFCYVISLAFPISVAHCGISVKLFLFLYCLVLCSHLITVTLVTSVWKCILFSLKIHSSITCLTMSCCSWSPLTPQYWTLCCSRCSVG